MKNIVESFYNWYRSTIRHPKYRWLIIGGTLIYLLSPLDISPDFLPVIGWIDDGILVALLIGEVSQMMASYLGDRTKSKAKTHEDPAAQAVIDVPIQ